MGKVSLFREACPVVPEDVQRVLGRIAEEWGNGDADMGYMLLWALTVRRMEARKKHPVFAEGKYQALGVIGEEYRELCHAVEYESDLRAKDEALDVAVTALRFYGGEHERKIWED